MSSVRSVVSRRALRLALALLVTAPAWPLHAPDAAAEPAGWPQWWDTDWSVRIPLQVGETLVLPGAVGLPGVDAVGMAEIDLDKALLDGGWPEDPDRPGRALAFEPDTTTMRVVRYQGLAPTGVVPHAAFDVPLASRPEVFPTGHRILTLVFPVAPPVPASYHLYIDRVGVGARAPTPLSAPAVAAVLSDLLGPGPNHIAAGIGRGRALVTVGGVGDGVTSVTVRDQEGGILCADIAVAGRGLGTCSADLGTTARAMVLRSDRPFVAYAYLTDDPASLPVPALPLPAHQGGWVGTTFTVPFAFSDPSASVDMRVEVHVPSSCPTPCQAVAEKLDDVGRATFPLTPGWPTALTDVKALSEARLTLPAPGTVFVNGVGPALLPVGTTGSFGVEGLDVPNALQLVVAGPPGRTVRYAFKDGSESGTVQFPAGEPTDPLQLSGTEPFAGGLRAGRTVTFETGPTVAAYPFLRAIGAASPMAPLPLVVTADGLATTLPAAHLANTELACPTIWVMPLLAETTVRVEARGGTSDPVRAGPEGPARIDLARTATCRDATVMAGVRPGPLLVRSTKGPFLGAAWFVLDNGKHLHPGTLVGLRAPHQVTVSPAHILGTVVSAEARPQDLFESPGQTATTAIIVRGAERLADGTVRSVPVHFRPAVVQGPPGVALPSVEVTSPGGVATTTPTQLGEARVTLPALVSEAQVHTTYRVRIPVEPDAGGLGSTAVFDATIIERHDIRLTFEDGTVESRIEVDQGATAVFTLTLENRGTGAERVNLAATPIPLDGWTTRILVAGVAVGPDAPVSLRPGESVRLLLEVRPPPAGEPAIVDTLVTARSAAVPGLAPSVRATVAHGVRADVTIALADKELHLHRGGTGTVNATFTNVGSPMDLTLTLATAGAGLTGGVVPGHVFLAPAGSPGDVGAATLNVSASPEAVIGTVNPAFLTATPGSGADRPIITVLFVVVDARHALGLVPDRTLLPGIQQRVVFTATNLGDATEAAVPSVLERPAGWTIEAAGTLLVPVGGRATLPFNVTLPPRDAAGARTITFRFTPTDGTAPFDVVADVAVADGPVFRAEGATGIDLARGQPMTLPLQVENVGNRDGVLRPTAKADGLRFAFAPPESSLAPGASLQVGVEITPLAPGNHTVTIEAEPGPGHRLRLPTGVARLTATIEATDPATPRGDGPFRAVVRVTNSGDAPARELPVQLASRNGVHANTTIHLLPPGRSASVSLAWERAEVGKDLAVVVDPEGVFSDGTPVVVPLGAKDTPWPPAPWLPLLAAAAAVLLARRRPAR